MGSPWSILYASLSYDKYMLDAGCEMNIEYMSLYDEMTVSDYWIWLKEQICNESPALVAFWLNEFTYLNWRQKKSVEELTSILGK